MFDVYVLEKMGEAAVTRWSQASVNATSPGSMSPSAADMDCTKLTTSPFAAATCAWRAM